MTRRRSSLARTLTVILVAAAVVPLVLAGMAVATDRAASVDQNLAATASDLQAATARLAQLDEQMRADALIAAQNAALRQWFTRPDMRGELQAQITQALVTLDMAYPDLVDESCVIDVDGREVARAVKDRGAPLEDLSDEEMDAPFFAGGFDAAVGEVYSPAPYVSADSGRWVLAAVSPVEANGRKAALMHYEVAVEGIRGLLARSGSEDARVRVLDDRGNLVLDTAGAEVTDRPFAPAADAGDGAVLQTRQMTFAGMPWTVQALRSERSGNAGKQVLLLALAVTSAVLLAGAVWFTRRRLRCLGQLEAAATSVAAGDLRVRAGIGGRDEIAHAGYAFDAAVGRLHAAVSQTRDAAADLAHRALELDGHAAGLEQATAVVQGAASASLGVAEDTSSAVTAGERAWQGLAGHMSTVADAAANASHAAADVLELSSAGQGTVSGLESSRQLIADMLDAIVDVAGRTRMLALNATIEAARAGDSGRGFAVVALEVKELAGQADESAARVGEQVEHIAHASGEAAQSLTDITRAVRGVSDIAGRIEQAVTAQGAQTQELLTTLQQAAAAADRMRSQSSLVATQAQSSAEVAAATREQAAALAATAEQLQALAHGFTV